MGQEQVVIAYGNRLRGDDGVGPIAAEAVRSWNLPGVKVIVVPQLLPEVVDDFKDAARVLFIDAAAREEGLFSCRRIEPMRSRNALGHYQAPGGLLALLHDLEGHAPPAWMLAISAVSFELGAELSEVARDNLHAALAFARPWLAEAPCTKSD